MAKRSDAVPWLRLWAVAWNIREAARSCCRCIALLVGFTGCCSQHTLVVSRLLLVKTALLWLRVCSIELCMWVGFMTTVFVVCWLGSLALSVVYLYANCAWPCCNGTGCFCTSDVLVGCWCWCVELNGYPSSCPVSLALLLCFTCQQTATCCFSWLVNVNYLDWLSGWNLSY